MFALLIYKMFMNVICSISDAVGKVNKKMWYSIMFSVKKPKMSGDAWKCIGRCSKIHWGAFGKTSGGFLKNLGRIFEKTRDFLIFAYCTKIYINGRFSIVESP